MIQFFKRLFCFHRKGQETAMYRFVKGKLKRLCPGCGKYVVGRGRARSWH